MSSRVKIGTLSRDRKKLFPQMWGGIGGPDLDISSYLMNAEASQLIALVKSACRVFRLPPVVKIEGAARDQAVECYISGDPHREQEIRSMDYEADWSRVVSKEVLMKWIEKNRTDVWLLLKADEL